MGKEYLACAFDSKGKTFRHEIYEDYKANRDSTPEGILSAIPLIKEFLKTFNIPIIFADGYEADDVIGTISKLASQNSYEVYMYTPDKDFAQLVSENVYMYRPGQRGAAHQIWDTNMVCEKFEINNVSQVIDYLGMVGDSVDNILLKHPDIVSCFTDAKGPNLGAIQTYQLINTYFNNGFFIKPFFYKENGPPNSDINGVCHRKAACKS